VFLHLNLIKPKEITNPRIDMYQISETLAGKWKTAVDDPDCQIIALTGAGISAESGIPTFRGEDGYWKIGSMNYTPMEMATVEKFRNYPWEVWHWYLTRIYKHRSAQPNDGHRALVELEKLLGERFQLITQNVDGLHLKAGNSPEKVYEIHGNLNYMRIFDSSRPSLLPMPDFDEELDPKEPLPEEVKSKLRDEAGNLMRPHVLWFDEIYNEELYRSESALKAAQEADLLLTIGTTGATSLPAVILKTVAQNGGTIIDINPEVTWFSDYAMISGGYHLKGPSGVFLPKLMKLVG
jgi:NAD-dependent deacetylase